jgi:hypothetical protein
MPRPIVSDKNGFFAKHLGATNQPEGDQFNAGPSAMEALKSGAIDATYVGPGPATTVDSLAGPDVSGLTASQSWLAMKWCSDMKRTSGEMPEVLFMSVRSWP